MSDDSPELVWVVTFLCLIVSTYRAWLSEHRARLAAKLDPLIEDVRLLRKLWDKIQYDHKDSQRPRLADVMNNQDARRSLNALGYTKVLEEHAALLARQRTRIAG